MNCMLLTILCFLILLLMEQKYVFLCVTEEHGAQVSMCSMRSVRFGLFSVIRAIPEGIAFCHMAAPPAEAAECGPGRKLWPGMRVGVTAYLLQRPPITENKNSNA